MALRFRTRLTLTTSFLIFLTVAAMTLVVVVILVYNMTLQYENTGRVLTQLANRNIAYGLRLPEKVMERIEDQMVVQALLTAELVALAESQGTPSPDSVTDALRRVQERSAQLRGYPLVDEFIITDEVGRVYIRSSTNPAKDRATGGPLENAEDFVSLFDPQAQRVVSELTGPKGEAVKYVGVGGSDKPRIVQVGVGEDLVESITAEFHVEDFVKRFMLPDRFGLLAVINEAGHVVAAVDKDGKTGANIVAPGIVQFCTQFLPNADQEVAFLFMGRDIGVATRLMESADQTPTALFVLHRTESDLNYLAGRVGLVVTVGFVMILFGILVSIFLSRGLSKPITVLSKGAEEFGRGNLNYRLYLKRRDEFQGLAQAFNTMAISLQEYTHELEQESSRRERLESEFRIASDMQSALLPEAAPTVEELELLGWCQPSREVGGDYYDFIELAPGKIAVALGDATGKGVSAALLITQCSSMLQTLAAEVHEPAELLTLANRAFYKRVHATHRFVTLFLMVIDVNKGIATYSTAGHPAPMIVNGSTNNGRWLHIQANYPLGIEENTVYTQEEISLEALDTIVMFSDGLTDAQNAQREAYGEKRIGALLQSTASESAQDIMRGLRKDAEKHMDGKDPIDDMTIVVLRFNPKVQARV